MYDSLLAGLPHKLKCSILLSSEKGSSSWLTSLPLVDQGFALHKGAFCDALCLCYVCMVANIITLSLCIWKDIVC